jgi:hypothetical protein
MTRRTGWMAATVISVVGVTIVAARLMANSVVHGSYLNLGVHEDSVQAGPDSARIVSFLTAMRTGDPLVCELLSDQIGNFWNSHGDDGVGRFTDARKSVDAAKDSVHGRIAGAGAIAVLVEALNSGDPCVRRELARAQRDRQCATDATAVRCLAPHARSRSVRHR